jgi:predicted GH43/DUF377 family glycosyl hydrolase
MKRLILILFIPLAIIQTGDLFSQNFLNDGDNSYRNASLQKMMMYEDKTRQGVPFSKDPHVVKFENRYIMYYSVPPFADTTNPIKGWNIGIAQSNDLIQWEKIGEITPEGEVESKGLCAPCALVIDGKIHLFYQTYGNGRNDAICHAISEDGVGFYRDPSNPVFKPKGDWNCGRAIDAEVVMFNGQYLLYFATRDPEYKIQMQGVAVANAETDLKMNPSWFLSLIGKESVWKERRSFKKATNYLCFMPDRITMLPSK